MIQKNIILRGRWTICNSINIKYTTQLVYNNSTYEIDYHIYKPECIINENV